MKGTNVNATGIEAHVNRAALLLMYGNMPVLNIAAINGTKKTIGRGVHVIGLELPRSFSRIADLPVDFSIGRGVSSSTMWNKFCAVLRPTRCARTMNVQACGILRRRAGALFSIGKWECYLSD